MAYEREKRGQFSSSQLDLRVQLHVIHSHSLSNVAVL